MDYSNKKMKRKRDESDDKDELEKDEKRRKFEEEKNTRLQDIPLSELNKHLLKLINDLSEDECSSLGEIYYRSNDFEMSLKFATRCIELGPTKYTNYVNRAQTYQKLGLFSKSLSDYEQSIKLNPKYGLGYQKMGIIQVNNLGDKESALKNFNTAIEINPEIAEIYYNRGIVREDLRDFENAKIDYTKAVELKIDFYEAYYNRAIINEQVFGDYEASLSDYDLAIRYNPSFEDGYYCRGLLLARKLKKVNLGIEDFTKAIELNEKGINSYCNRGNCYKLLGLYENSMKDYLKCIEIDPKFGKAYYNLGLLYNYQFDDRKLAMKYYTLAIKYNENYSNALCNRGVLFQSQGKFKEAMKDYSKAIKTGEKGPEFSKNYFNRGCLYEYVLHNYVLSIKDISKFEQLESFESGTLAISSVEKLKNKIFGKDISKW